MPRYLVCLDPQPAQDGSCAQTAWMEVGGIVQYLPTVEQANVVGSLFFASLLTIAAAKRILKPPRHL